MDGPLSGVASCDDSSTQFDLEGLPAEGSRGNRIPRGGCREKERLVFFSETG